MAAIRTAEVVWDHDLLKGSGHVSGGSGSFRNLGLSWASRTEQPGANTSPEELLAAAHAGCFSMSLSATLARRQHPPEQLRVTARCTFDKVGDSWKVTTMELDVRGKVPGVTAAEFAEAAGVAEANCPISKALHGNVAIRVNAALA